MAVVIETTLGDITVDLFTEERPRTCLNFLKLCKIKYYNLCLFHSVQHNFLAQTGDPTGSGKNGESVFGKIHGEGARFYEAEAMPKLKHSKPGLLSMVSCGNNMLGSQFFITLGSELQSLDSEHCVFGEVTEGREVLLKLNEVICDSEHRPYQDVRITHTVILDDPFDDPCGLQVPDRSPEPSAATLTNGRIAPDEDLDETRGLSAVEVEERERSREARAQATILEIVGDLPDAEMAPPENVLFVCKLNPVTSDDDLEIIFSRFGKVKSCEVIRDKVTGDSLQYAFVEFEDRKACEDAYFKMDNVLIDDRRIHVDFSQSVSRIRWRGKGRGVQHISEEAEAEQDTRGMTAEDGRTAGRAESHDEEYRKHDHANGRSSRGNESSKDNNDMYMKSRKHEDERKRGYRQEGERSDRGKHERSRHSYGRSSEVSRTKREEGNARSSDSKRLNDVNIRQEQRNRHSSEEGKTYREAHKDMGNKREKTYERADRNVRNEKERTYGEEDKYGRKDRGTKYEEAEKNVRKGRDKTYETVDKNARNERERTYGEVDKYMKKDRATAYKEVDRNLRKEREKMNEEADKNVRKEKERTYTEVDVRKERDKTSGEPDRTVRNEEVRRYKNDEGSTAVKLNSEGQKSGKEAKERDTATTKEKSDKEENKSRQSSLLAQKRKKHRRSTSSDSHSSSSSDLTSSTSSSSSESSVEKSKVRHKKHHKRPTVLVKKSKKKQKLSKKKRRKQRKDSSGSDSSDSGSSATPGNKKKRSRKDTSTEEDSSSEDEAKQKKKNKKRKKVALKRKRKFSSSEDSETEDTSDTSSDSEDKKASKKRCKAVKKSKKSHTKKKKKRKRKSSLRKNKSDHSSCGDASD